MSEDRHRLHHRQLDLLTYRPTSRVLHHHLVTPLIDLACTGYRQPRTRRPFNLTPIKPPLILNRLRPQRLDRKRRRLPFNHTRHHRLLRNRYRHMHRQLHLFTHHRPSLVADANRILRLVLRRQCLKRKLPGLGTLYGLFTLVPLVYHRLGSTRHHRQRQLLTKQPGLTRRLSEDRHRLNHRQLDLLTYQRSGRVLHHHLVTADVFLIDIGDCQNGFVAICNGLTIKKPLIAYWLTP